MACASTETAGVANIDDRQRLVDAAAMPNPQPAAASTLSWPTDAFKAITPHIAISVVQLVLQPRLWIHRRVETIEFLDVGRVRRRTSVDFTVPQQRRVPVTLSTGQKVAFMPIALLHKRVLRSFNLRDATGMALPLLTQDQNSAVAVALLRGLATALVKPETLDTHIERELEQIASTSEAEAANALRNLSTPMGPGSHSQRNTLWGKSSFKTLANDLSQNFMLIVPLDAAVGDRRLLKFEYEENFKSRALTKLEWLGLTPVELAFLAPSVGLTESYHAEVVAPDELVIAKAELVAQNLDGSEDTLDTEHHQFRAHVHASGLTRGTIGRLNVSIRLRTAGLVLAAFVLSIATATSLVGGVVVDWLDVGATPDLASALLVALPGIYATYLVRPGEHRLVKWLVGGLRVIVLGLAAVSFGAAATLALNLDESLRQLLWALGSVYALFAIAVTGASIGMSIRRQKRDGGN